MRLLIRLLTLLAPWVALAVFMGAVQDETPYIVRNMLPLALALAFLVYNLVRNRGGWLYPHVQQAVAAIGFGLVVFGLNLYVHILWFYDIDGLRSAATQPELLFRYLPAYAVLAGGIGCAIGWIIGRALTKSEH